jgi:hypothetical protein
VATRWGRNNNVEVNYRNVKDDNKISKCEEEFGDGG